MKTLKRLGLAGLLFAVALALASCGGGAGSSGGGQDDGTQRKDQGESGGETVQEETTSGTQGMGGMNHGSNSTDEMARQMVAPNGEYSDAAFVDAMVPHHEGAVEMAEVALDNAEHEEIRTLSRQIIASQRAEIELFDRLRGELDGPTMEGMSEEEMNQTMGMTDARQLAVQRPFDRAFIDAMIPHHESAISMADVALQESENPEIRRMAEDIVGAQEREIEQMRRWRQEWYPEG